MTGGKPETIKDAVANFIVKEIPRIKVEPNYVAINELIQGLYGNAATLSTTLGGERHRYFRIIMKYMLYATLLHTAWVTPQDSVAGPTVPATANLAQRKQLQDEHNKKRRIYKNVHTMDEALKQHIIDAFYGTYVAELRHNYTGYLGFMTRDLLGHLLYLYGEISPLDIKENDTRYNESVDTAQPIDKYF